MRACSVLHPIVFLAFLMVHHLGTAQQVGQVIGERIDIISASGGGQVIHSLPLPPGPWHIASVVNRNTGTTATPMRDVLLVQTNGSALAFAIYVSANASNNRTRWTDEPCRVQSFNHKNDFGTRLWTQRCLVVQPSTFAQNDSRATRDVLAFASAQNIKLDLNSVVARYTDLDDKGLFVKYEFFVFPSNHGLENPPNANNNMSPYHSINIQRDAEKQKFVAAVIEYGEMLAVSVHAALSSAKGVFLRPFTYPDSGSPIGRSTPQPQSATIEQRLSTLKRAFDANLLTEAEYRLKRSQILDSF